MLVFLGKYFILAGESPRSVSNSRIRIPSTNVNKLIALSQVLPDIVRDDVTRDADGTQYQGVVYQDLIAVTFSK